MAKDKETGERETVSVMELAVNNAIVQTALAELLMEKGILTREEIMDKIKTVGEEWAERRKSILH